MFKVEADENTSGAIDQQEPNLMRPQRRARPSAREMRAALNERPGFREIQDVLRDIWRVAHLDDDFVTPAAFWEYVNFAGEDLDERANELLLAIKALQAFNAAKPNA
jgi:hypothetical protein